MKGVQILMMGGKLQGLGYGYLYNFFAAIEADFAPTDWKVPTEAEYETLITTVGGDTVGGGSLKEVGLEHWDSPNTGAVDSYGFTAWGGGQRDAGELGLFSVIKQFGKFWSTTAGSSTEAHFLRLRNITAAVDTSPFSGESKNLGHSIRLLYTGAGTPSTVTDEDGNVYDTIVIGSQRWTVQNWKCTKLNDGTPLTKVTDQVAWSALTTEGYCAYDNDENNV